MSDAQAQVWGDFEFFRPAGATCCIAGSDEGEIRPNFIPIGARG